MAEAEPIDNSVLHRRACGGFSAAAPDRPKSISRFL